MCCTACTCIDGSCAHKWKIRHSPCIRYARARAHKSPHHHNLCILFDGAHVRTTRYRHIPCTEPVVGCAHRFGTLHNPCTLRGGDRARRFGTLRMSRAPVLAQLEFVATIESMPHGVELQMYLFSRARSASLVVGPVCSSRKMSNLGTPRARMCT